MMIVRHEINTAFTVNSYSQRDKLKLYQLLQCITRDHQNGVFNGR